MVCLIMYNWREKKMSAYIAHCYLNDGETIGSIPGKVFEGQSILSGASVLLENFDSPWLCWGWLHEGFASPRAILLNGKRCQPRPPLDRSVAWLTTDCALRWLLGVFLFMCWQILSTDVSFDSGQVISTLRVLLMQNKNKHNGEWQMMLYNNPDL